MNPPSAAAAGREAALLARKQFKRIAKATLRRRVATADSIAETIWKRWGCGVYRWRLKHVRWFLSSAIADQKPTTRYQYWLVLRSLLIVLGKERWLGSLKGGWCHPQVRNSRSIDEQSIHGAVSVK